MKIELTQEQLTLVVSSVLQSLRTNSKAISELTLVSTVSSGDYIELSEGKRIAVSTIVDEIIDNIGGGGGGGGGSTEGKADKVSGATNGHLAGLNSSGNLTDSGIAIVTCTQSQYDLSTKDSNTLYFIQEASS